MEYTPLEDGITHINIYTKAQTKLGQILSNLAHTPFTVEDGHFESVEGYWGWLSISENNSEREKFRQIYGVAARNFKRDLLKAGDPGRFDPQFAEKIGRAIHAKFLTPIVNEAILNDIDLLTLPITHYYYYGKTLDNIKVIDETEKYPEFINSVRKEIQLWKLRESLEMKNKYHIYIIENDAGNIKIGITQNFDNRLKNLSGSNGGGNKITRTWVSPETYLYSLEDNLHTKYNTNRVPGTEWFKGLDFDTVVADTDKLFKSESYIKCNDVRRQFEETRSVSDITTITDGIICHQVNCQNVMGAGLAKTLSDKYPIVKERYHAFCSKTPKEELFGKTQIVKISDTLMVANIFSQFNYGNAYKTKERYTDYDKLCNALIKISETFPDKNIYIPSRIGCGLGGGNWTILESKIKDLNLPNLYIVKSLDSNKERPEYYNKSIEEQEK